MHDTTAKVVRRSSSLPLWQVLDLFVSFCLETSDTITLLASQFIMACVFVKVTMNMALLLGHKIACLLSQGEMPEEGWKGRGLGGRGGGVSFSSVFLWHNMNMLASLSLSLSLSLSRQDSVKIFHKETSTTQHTSYFIEYTISLEK